MFRLNLKMCLVSQTEPTLHNVHGGVPTNATKVGESAAISSSQLFVLGYTACAGAVSLPALHSVTFTRGPQT